MRESEYKSVVVENIVERFQLIDIIGRRDDGIGGIFGGFFAPFQKQSENAHNFQKKRKNKENNYLLTLYQVNVANAIG